MMLGASASGTVKTTAIACRCIASIGCLPRAPVEQLRQKRLRLRAPLRYSPPPLHFGTFLLTVSQAEDFESKRQSQVRDRHLSPRLYLSYTPQLADRAFARGIVSSSSFVEDAATPRANEMVMSAAALSKYTSSTDISRKSRKV
jgi:hypothetical protein